MGTRVFNRRRCRKHPETGRRSSVLNPQSEWIREPAPQLRIIDDESWAAVQARQAQVSAAPASHARKPKRLLSGLMKCGLCGSDMTLNGGKYTCSANRERGTCSNGKIIAAQTVERRMIEGIRNHLLAPRAVTVALRDFSSAPTPSVMTWRSSGNWPSLDHAPASPFCRVGVKRRKPPGDMLGGFM